MAIINNATTTAQETRTLPRGNSGWEQIGAAGGIVFVVLQMANQPILLPASLAHLSESLAFLVIRALWEEETMNDQRFWRMERAAGLFLVLGFVTNADSATGSWCSA